MTVPTLDPFTYEVLRHRLAAIAREGAIALQRVSGSPLATEAFDLNTSIMSAAGEVAFVGPFLLTGPMGQGMIARAILADYAENPGIAPGDMFLCNDPYVGAAHQNCVTLVAPIHAGDRLIAWAGATLHVVDVGGPIAGQVGIGARSIFEEAPPIPPIRIIAGGRLLRDVEAEYLRRSRTPELNGLDLRAKIAALNTIRERVLAVVAAHGAEAVEAVVATTIERGVAHLRRRIAELGSGPVVQSAFVDHDEDGESRLFEIRLRIERAGDSLVFDFGGSSPQAGAVVNCTRSGLASGVLVGVLTTLVWDAPWCPAAIERTIDIRTEQGTIVDAAWPAGCSMATMGAGFAATTVTAIGLGRLLAASEQHRDRAMASWAGAVGSIDVFGTDAEGRPFGTVLLDSMASGTGARSWADGIDSGGFLRSIACVVSNVEQYEARYPLVYVWRRHEPDTGGAGRRRGGAGISFALLPHGVPGLPAVIPHFGGTIEPESAGLAGGYPGATNAIRVVRSSGALARMAAGHLPADPADLEGQAQSLPGVARIALGSDDVLVAVASGGGGWGDPIERDPALVAADVRAGLVGAESARREYGVVVDAHGEPDGRVTGARRRAIRRRRARQAGSPGRVPSPPTVAVAGTAPDGIVRPSGQRRRAACPRCGADFPLGDDRDPLASLPTAVRPLSAAGPQVAPDRADARFVLVERYCPRCLRLVAAERIAVSHLEDRRVPNRAAARRHPERGLPSGRRARR